ncbi:MAG TPA: sigma-54-dependent Fis family transcriptional regulator [Nitrospirae bacterium]|nr:sigma-54-dependent Fis family transcriptional regulator [Nitrospirota bacterium]
MSENKKIKGTVLVIDDEPDLLESYARILEAGRYKCITTSDPFEASSLALSARPNAVITDFKMPGKSGVDILRDVRRQIPYVPVIIISAYATVEGVVEAVKLGAFDYLPKPFTSDQLIITVRRAVDQCRLYLENIALKDKLQEDFFNHHLVGKHPRILKIIKMIEKVSAAKTNILLYGEQGVGKEQVARAIHKNSERANGPFVPVDSATLTRENLEAAPVKGANRSSDSQNKSVFEAAEGGVLYLEKIEDLDIGIQAKLLKALQDKETVRRGGWEAVRIDVRMIASSTRDLREALNDGQLREDLYYHLNILKIEIPPLRHRKEDIGILCDHFLKEYARREDTRPKTLSFESLSKLMEYNWPGNISELRDVIETEASLSNSDTLALKDIPENAQPPGPLSGLTFKEAKRVWMRQFERQFLEDLLLMNKGNISQASEEAGIARMSLYRMLKRNDLTKLALHERSVEKGRLSDEGPETGGRRK